MTAVELRRVDPLRSFHDSEGACAALLSLLGAVACCDFGPQLTKRFLDFLARCIGRGRNWGALFRRQLSDGHDDALDVRARLCENALHVKIFAHDSSYYGVAPPRSSASRNVRNMPRS